MTTMINTETNKTSHHRIAKVLMIILGSATLIVFLCFLLGSGLALHAYFGQGFPTPVSDYKPVDSLSVPGFTGTSSPDTTPVSIVLDHSTRLHIPRNYLFDASLVNPYPHLQLTIMTTYPDFKGVDSTTMGKATSMQWLNSDDLIVIRRVIKASAYRDWNKGWLDRIAKEVGPLDSNPELHGYNRSVFYVKYKEPKEHSLLIQCPDTGRALTNTDFCEVYADVAPDFVVMYQFRPSLLPHWQTLDARVMQLLSSFVED